MNTVNPTHTAEQEQERKELVYAQEELKKSEKRFRALIEHSYDAISLRDEKGIILYQSPSTEKITGYKAEEVTGINLTAFIHPDDVKDLVQRLDTSLKNPGVPTYSVHRVKHKNGEYRWVEGTTTNLLHDENVRALVSNFRDITDRKLAQEKIDQNEKRFRALIENNYDAIFMRDRDGNIFYQSPNTLKITGYTLDEIKGQNFSAFLHPEDAPKLAKLLESPVAKPGVPVQGMHRVRHKNGQYRWMEGTITNLLEDENVRAIISNFRDTTERKLAEDKIEQNERRFRALIENSFDAIIMRDEKGTILYQSPAAERMTGYTVDEMQGRGREEFFHPDDIPEINKRLATVGKTPGQSAFGISRMRHKDGHYIWAERTTTNLLADESVRAIVGNFRDITKRKLAEEKLIYANRLYAILSEINHTITHINDEATLFKNVCQIAVNTGKFKAAWIAKHDETQQKLNLVESSGIGPNHISLFSTIEYEAKGGQGNVISTGNFYVSNDLVNNTSAVPWKSFIDDCDLKSYIALPIKKSGEIIATVSIVSQEINFFNTEEIMLLEKVTNDNSFALDLFEKEKKRKKIEAKIAHNELRLKQAQSLAHMGSWVFNFSSGIAKWSEEACRIYEINPEDNMHSFETWISFIHPGDLDYVMKQIKEHEKKFRNYAFHHRILRRDGTTRYIYSQVNFEFDAANRPAGLYGVCHDITETRKAQGALAQSEVNLRMIMDLIPQPIFAKNILGRYLFANKSYAALFGLTPQEIINKTVSEAVPLKQESDLFMSQDLEVIMSGKTKTTPDDVFTDYKGTRRLFSMVKVPYIDANTSEKAVLGITQDITEQKKAEEERAKMIADIVQRNKDLEQFSQIVSHNLRAPVANILGLVHVAETIGVDKCEEEKVLSHLGTAAGKLDEVIRDLNHILEIKHETRVEKEIVHFENLLDEIKLSIEDIIRDEQVLIKSDFSSAEELTTIKSYLYSILFNLISNSIKYHQPCITPIIEITSTRVGNKIQIVFKDNGLGIDLQRRGHEVFGLYKQFHNHVAGKGMGLYMVKTQVEALGGTIAIESEVNNGGSVK